MSNVRRYENFTLTSRGNALIGSLWCAVLAVSAVLEPRASAAIVIAFAIVGLAAGLFQGRCHPRKLNTSSHGRDFTGRQEGVRQFFAGQALRSAPLDSRRGHTCELLFRGGEYGTLSTAIGSYAAFSLAREMASLHGSRSSSPSPKWSRLSTERLTLPSSGLATDRPRYASSSFSAPRGLPLRASHVKR